MVDHERCILPRAVCAVCADARYTLLHIYAHVRILSLAEQLVEEASEHAARLCWGRRHGCSRRYVAPCDCFKRGLLNGDGDASEGLGIPVMVIRVKEMVLGVEKILVHEVDVYMQERGLRKTWWATLRVLLSHACSECATSLFSFQPTLPLICLLLLRHQGGHIPCSTLLLLLELRAGGVEDGRVNGPRHRAQVGGGVDHGLRLARQLAPGIGEHGHLAGSERLCGSEG